MTSPTTSIAAVFVGIVLGAIFLIGLPVGLAWITFDTLFCRSRRVAPGMALVRRAPLVRSFRVIPASQAACCCQACGWLSAN